MANVRFACLALTRQWRVTVSKTQVLKRSSAEESDLNFASDQKRGANKRKLTATCATQCSKNGHNSFSFQIRGQS